jgi:hypothetical protein
MGLFDRLQALIRGRNQSTAIDGVACVPAAANPFGIEIWDGRSFTQTMISTTGDPRLAESFLALRRSSGSEHANNTYEAPRVKGAYAAPALPQATPIRSRC